MAAMKLKLAISPVPMPLWGDNLRWLIGRHYWGKIRTRFIAEHGMQCAICGKVVAESKKISLHE
jgi:hypothetical protein